MQATQRVVIVGGGTAGWLAAARLGAMQRAGVSITLVESPNVPTVGVGEGTWPSMRATLQAIGLSEREMLSYCNASLKQGTLFRGWRDGEQRDVYLHPFSLPPEYSSTNLAEYWRAGGLEVPFSDVITPQAMIAATNRAPKTADTPDYAFALNYGYHLDAVKFADLLRKHSVDRLGVHHVLDHVNEVHQDAEGYLTRIDLEGGGVLEGDLFIDCTGQRALLLNDHMGAEFTSMRGVLPNNRAVVTQVPYVNPDDEIHSCTQSTAQACGWIWDIGLQSRRGVGYVHDADFISEADAEATLRAYVAETASPDIAEAVQCRVLNFEPGYRDTPWLNNCVAVGLSAGFIEPLEASALAMIEQAVSFLVDNFPHDRALMGPVSRAFNAKMQDHWASIIEFLKLHYVLSERDDTEYWRRARDMAGTPEALQDKMALWQIRAPWHSDAPRVDALFPAASYQYVWLGMGGHRKAEPMGRLPEGTLRELDRTLNGVREKAVKLQKSMPGNRELLNALTLQTRAPELAVG